MSRPHPHLAPIGERLADLGHASLAYDVSHLGSSLSSESAAVGCWDRVVTLLEEAARRDEASGRADLLAEIAMLRRIAMLAPATACVATPARCNGLCSGECVPTALRGARL